MSSKINLQTCEYARKSSIFQDNQLIYYKSQMNKSKIAQKMKNKQQVSCQRKQKNVE